MTPASAICPQCQAPFVAKYRYDTKRYAVFCSRECANLSRAVSADTRFDALWAEDLSSGCHLWTGARRYEGRIGYGSFYNDGRRIGAHVFSWQRKRGPVPPGLFVLHECDVPACVNIEHLFLGTNLENMRDRDQKGRVQHGEGHYAAKLTADDIRAIRASSAANVELAEQYGVSAGHISGIKSREKWKHVT